MGHHEIDPRLAKLQARRYHVNITTIDNGNFTKCGEFYYDSLRAARAFIRAQFREFNDRWGFDDSEYSAQFWKDVWTRGGVVMAVDEDDSEQSRFSAHLVDTQNPPVKERCSVWIDIDLRSESQDRFADAALAEADAEERA